MSAELPDSYQALYQRAIQQMGVGESQEAIDSLLRIVKRLSRLRAETLQRKNNLQQTLSVSWNAVTRFLSWEGRHQEAIDLTAEVMDRLPDPVAGSIRIAALTIESGQVEQGLSSLTKIAREEDSFSAWYALGTEYKILQRHGEAIDAYRSALRRASSNEDAVIGNLALLDVYRASERIEDALDTWKMALVLEPDLAEREHQVYSWLIRNGHENEAATYLERELGPIRRTFFEGLIDWQADRQDAARNKWQEVLDSDIELEDDVDVEVKMEAALRLGLPQSADELARTFFLSGELPSIRVEVLRAIAKLLLGQRDSARDYLQQALLRFRRTFRLHTGLAADQWALLTQLVPDPGQTADLARFFDTGT